jgi:hypothetical protein
VLTGITLKPEKGDTLLVIDTASASLILWKLFTGRIVVHDLALGKTCLSIIQSDTLNNTQFLLNRKKQKNNVDSLGKRNYAKTLSRLASALFEKIPATLKITDLTVSHQKNGHKVSFHVDHFVADYNAFHTLVSVT